MNQKKNRKPFAGIICPIHIQVDLTEDEYQDQMASSGDWLCPKCGMPSEFDEDRYEEIHGWS